VHTLLIPILLVGYHALDRIEFDLPFFISVCSCLCELANKALMHCDGVVLSF
jgi:hypothetical protein